MNTQGMRSFGALFMVLLFLMGALVVHPEWSAQAQGKKIQGIIYDAATPEKVISASVTLTDVHSLVNLTTSTVGNTYEFLPSPGYYNITVKAQGYFDAGTTQPFRYDGTVLLQFDFPLTIYPSRDHTLSVLVTEAAGTTWTEDLYFPRFNIFAENAAANFTNVPPPNHTTLKNKPLVSIQNVRWRDLSSGTSTFLPPSEYAITDKWAGTVSIANITISNTLIPLPPNQRSPPYYLNFSYTYSSTIAQLNHTPVVPGTYRLYKNGLDWMSQENIDWKLDANLGTVTVLGSFNWGVDRLNMTWDSTGVVTGASVAFYNTTKMQLIDTSRLTDGNGMVQFAIWPGTWEVWTSKATYETTVTSGYYDSDQTERVQLQFGIVVVGYASDSEGFIREGVKAFLYNTDVNTPIAKKVLRASVTGPQFTFRAYTGTFRLVVDADWHASNVSTISVGTSAMSLGTKFLDVSRDENVETSLIFKDDSWNNLTIYRNYSFNRDSQILGLNPFDLRDASLQIDYTLGNGNGLVEASEWNAFRLWWEKNGPATVDTQKLLTTNGLIYLSNVSGTKDRANTQYRAGTTPLGFYPMWINDTAFYYTKGTTTIPYGKKQYFLNFTGIWDTNVTVYHNMTYTIDLPKRYEMTETTFRSPGLSIENFTRMELDPSSGSGVPRADMIVRLSENGTARARVKGPIGHYQELNSSLENYTAVVMGNFNITYSADQSFDPIGKISDANFTWQFEPGLSGRRFGMDVEYNYTIGKEYTVNLTVREAGGNYTYRVFTILVDVLNPVASIWTNKSVGGSTATANNTTIRIDENLPVKFDSTRSTDLIFGSKEGEVVETHWDFDGDGLEDGVIPPGNIVNHSYEKPGNYTLFMWVVDSVGHRSVNASMNLIVNDTTPPSIDFVIYDSNNLAVQTLMEGKPFTFNASKTTDNYDALNNLTFTWDFGDNDTDSIHTGKGFAGYNVSHNYKVFNSSYRLKLNVSDHGFYGKDVNYKVLERVITVQVDTTKRPNLVMKSGSFVASPADPEEGTDVVISVTVSNDANRGDANSVSVSLQVRSGATYVAVQISPTYYNGSVVSNNVIPSGQERRIEFVWKADVPGARFLKVVVNDPDEPHTWVSDNSIESTVNTREAGWKMPAIIGVVVFLIFGVPILYYLFKKYRAGEISLPRRKKEEEEKPSKKEPAGEKKEKKRL